MVNKISFLIICFIFICFGVSKAQQNNNWEKTGIASIENGKFKVILGSTYNIINTESYGKIHLKHKHLDSLDVQRIDDRYFKSTFRKLKKTSIEIKNF
ncbi:MAG: hypothetical protein ABR595_10565, partial [Psychroflexus sp.]